MGCCAAGRAPCRRFRCPCWLPPSGASSPTEGATASRAATTPSLSGSRPAATARAGRWAAGTSSCTAADRRGLLSSAAPVGGSPGPLLTLQKRPEIGYPLVSDGGSALVG